MAPHFPRPHRHVFLLFALFIFLIYGNTFNTAWHLDDFPQIIQNSKVTIRDIGPDSLSKHFNQIWVQGWRQRPLAITTLALNYYFGAEDPQGYHLVNILIHLLTAYFLYLALWALFNSPRLKSSYDDRQRQFVCLLAAILWAANPIQTQAVTYVVQRMAAMAGMFSIGGIWLYLRARLAGVFQKKLIYFLLSAFSFMAAVLCKENAAAFPLSLILLEAAFFLDLRLRKALMVRLTVLAAGGLVLLAVGAFVYFDGDPLSVLKYSDRTFTPLERLLTQPRVLLEYLSLIFYPVPTRLSIVHGIEVSTSLLSPWTTLPALIGVFSIVAMACICIRKWPVLSFALLFFFCNHLIESSIIGLELFFEHRNYLPSMFLFLPVSMGLSHLLNRLRGARVIGYFSLCAFIPLLLIALGTGTYIRNSYWGSTKSIWEDALSKAPGESRPFLMMACNYYARIGNTDMALQLYTHALDLRQNRRSYAALIYNNMAAIYFDRADYVRAVEYWNKAIEFHPDHRVVRYHLAEALVKLDRPEEALVQLDNILKEQPGYLLPLNLKGMILVRQGRLPEGLTYFKKCVRPNAANRSLLINLGAAFHFLGDPVKAGIYLKEAHKLAPNDRTVLLWLAKNRLSGGWPKLADDYIRLLFSTGSLSSLNSWLQSRGTPAFKEDDVIAPELDEQLVRKMIENFKSEPFFVKSINSPNEKNSGPQYDGD